MLVDILHDSELYHDNYSNMTDEELAAVAKKDHSVLPLLLARFSHVILVKSEVIGGNTVDKDDLRQEGLIGLFRAVNSYDPERGAKFSTYAEVCMTNRMKSYSARQHNERRVPESLDDENNSEELTVKETPESIYLYKEFMTELWENINNSLSNMEKRVFYLCVIDGISYHDAAVKLGVGDKSVDNAMQRVRKKLRMLMHRN